MVVIDLYLTKSNSDGLQLRVVSTRVESLPRNLRTSNLPEARVFRITQETACIHIVPYSGSRKTVGISPSTLIRLYEIRSSGSRWYNHITGTLGLRSMEQIDNIHLPIYPCIYPARFPPRTVISHSTNTSVESTGSTVTTQFVATQTLKRTFLKC